MKAYQHLWRLMRYRPWLYASNALVWWAIHMVPIIPGLITQHYFNVLPKVQGLNQDLLLLLLLILMTAMGRVMMIFTGGLTDTLHRFSVSGLLRRNMLKQILEHPGARAIPGSPGEVISRFSEDASQVEDVVSWTLDATGKGFFALISFMILLRINMVITLCVFLPLVGVVSIVQSQKKRLEKLRSASRKAAGHITSAIGEIFSTVQGIQLAAAEEHVLHHFQRLNEQRRKTMLQDRLLEQILNSTFANMLSIGTGLILLLAAQALQAKQLGIGDLALFIYYLVFVSEFTDLLGLLLAHYAQTKVAFERMKALLQGAPPEQLTQHKPLYLGETLSDLIRLPQIDEPLQMLEVQGLSYRYPDTGRGIEQIELQLKKGTLTVITGRVASGKTTILQVLLGLLPKDTGTILWNGVEVADPASFFVPPHSAYTPQVPRLFSATLKENILLGLPEQPAQLREALHTAVMEQDIAGLEDGLETLIGTRGVKLSGGQLQRTAAARMFIRTPELLVFDDLSSALDVETEKILWERVFDNKNTQTCLVVSHRRAVLQRADQIIVLKEGTIEATGTLIELLEQSGEMQRLWHTEERDSSLRQI